MRFSCIMWILSSLPVFSRVRKMMDRKFIVLVDGQDMHHRFQFDGSSNSWDWSLHRSAGKVSQTGREGKKEKWTICGATVCTANDVLVREILS